MQYKEFMRHLGKAGITVKQFADAVKMNSNSISNLAKQVEVPSHLAIIATLMGLLADNHIDFLDSIKRIEIKPKKPRGVASNVSFVEKNAFIPDSADDK